MIGTSICCFLTAIHSQLSALFKILMRGLSNDLYRLQWAS